MMIDELRNIIDKEYRHPFYNECQEIADMARTIHASKGEDQKKELERFRGGEGHALMSQRVKLHNPITAAILQPTYSYFSYVYRAEGIKRIHRMDDRNKEKLIEDNFARFYGEISLHEYIFKAVEHYNKYDPNAWVGFERENVVTESGQLQSVNIYPVEFSSKAVIDFREDLSGRVKELTAMYHFSGVNAKGQIRDGLEHYLHYYPGGVIVAYQQEQEFTSPDVDDSFVLMTFTRGKKVMEFWVKMVENGTAEVPFFRAGAEDHPEHRNKVKALFVHNAQGLLLDIATDSNLLKVQKIVHCWAEKSEYVKPCRHVNEQEQSCEGGYYGGIRTAENLCQSCQGSGVVVTATEQTVKRLMWPERAEDLIELSKTSHYHERPLNIAEFYVSEIERQSDLVFATTYNQNNTRPAGAPRTATEITVNADLINNKLTPIASRVEDGWELAHRIAHQYYETNGDVEMAHPSDFKVLTVSELIQRHKEAVEASVPVAVRASIVDDLLNKQYSNFPDLKYDIKAFESWKPWKDKTVEEVALIVSLRAEDDFFRQLWENWDAIVQQVKYALDPAGQPRFYLLSRERQMTALQDAISKVMELSSYQELQDPEPIDIPPIEILED